LWADAGIDVLFDVVVEGEGALDIRWQRDWP
jgi:hypothetical protein